MMSTITERDLKGNSRVTCCENTHWITPHEANLGPITHHADNLGPIIRHGKHLWKHLCVKRDFPAKENAYQYSAILLISWFSVALLTDTKTKRTKWMGVMFISHLKACWTWCINAGGMNDVTAQLPEDLTIALSEGHFRTISLPLQI